MPIQADNINKILGELDVTGKGIAELEDLFTL